MGSPWAPARSSCCAARTTFAILRARVHITDETLVRVNDGKCDPAGRFFAGTAANDGRWGTGALYRLGADHSLELVLAGITCANGLGWSLDSRTFYYVDTPTYRIDAFDFDPERGSLSNRRVFARIEGGGRPDGLCIDSEGCLWVAIWLGWEVRRYAPDGQPAHEGQGTDSAGEQLRFRRSRPRCPVHHLGVQLPDEGREGRPAPRRSDLRLFTGRPWVAARSVRRLNRHNDGTGDSEAGDSEAGDYEAGDYEAGNDEGAA